MGKFDGLLILSDLDGTFSGPTEDIVTENAKAVKYFTANGGKFGFATGRSPHFMKNKDYFSIINAPCVFLNGGVVYDVVDDEVLYERHVDFSVGEFLETIADDQKEIVKICAHKDCYEEDSVFTDFNGLDRELLCSKPIKVICVFESVEKALAFKAKVLSMPFFQSTYISRSWSFGVEFNAFNGTKGNAIRFIKDYLGNIHASIGVGDFENDLSLILNADVGVAVGNAVEELKQTADLVVNRCSEYAIKDVIERLDTKF